MPNLSDLSVRILDAAVADAIAAAQWDRIDLQTRRPGQDPKDLLLAKAAELAMSPIARDQLLSAALEHGVESFHPDRPLIDLDCCSGARSVIIDRVFALGPHQRSETESVVSAIEARHARRLCQDARYDLLAECLRQDAVLQEELWSHPGIPASDAVRLTMLCSIPKLLERAETLSGEGPWRFVNRWINRLAGSGA